LFWWFYWGKLSEKIRNIFEEAHKNYPSAIFIYEFDNLFPSDEIIPKLVLKSLINDKRYWTHQELSKFLCSHVWIGYRNTSFQIWAGLIIEFLLIYQMKTLGMILFGISFRKNFLGLIMKIYFVLFRKTWFVIRQKILKKVLDEITHFIEISHQEWNQYCIGMTLRKIRQYISLEERQNYQNWINKH
jgi:hypothetical protein